MQILSLKKIFLILKQLFFPSRKIIRIDNEKIKIPIKPETQSMISKFAKLNGLDLVDLSSKQLAFRLDDHSCYFLNKGHCSLSLTEDEVLKENIPPDNGLNRGEDVYFCRNLLDSMQNEQHMKDLFMDGEPAIEKASCGHYKCNGQHRLCVAKHAGLKIPVEQINQINNMCGVCRGEESSPYALYR